MNEQIIADFGSAFQTLEHTYSICMQRLLAKYGLYPGQPQLLFALRRITKPTQNELAICLSLSKASVGMSVRRLEKAGFVKRIRDREDTRCIRIALTKKGEDYAKWCEIDFDMLFATMLENVLPSERENLMMNIRQMQSSLDGLHERLDS